MATNKRDAKQEANKKRGITASKNNGNIKIFCKNSNNKIRNNVTFKNELETLIEDTINEKENLGTLQYPFLLDSVIESKPDLKNQIEAFRSDKGCNPLTNL